MDYRTERAGIRFNFQYSNELADRIADRLQELVGATSQKAALIGHSRGGCLAKVVADRHPLLVEQVIALGAPLRDPYDVHGATMAGVRLAHIYNLLRTGRGHREELGFLEELAAPAAVPLTSIYTRSDGVVSWHACVRSDVECLEVKGTHVGLPVNPGTFRIIARRLAERWAGS
jgi:pimeloyl-ACP methyl ester carboxylesterase